MSLEGQQLGKYLLLHRIGKGGFGEVYLAEDTALKRQVAIKVISPQADSAKLSEDLRLFEREVQAIAKLDHPYILPLYDYGEAGVDKTTFPYMVMPYCQGGTLKTWLEQRQTGNLPCDIISHFLSQAAGTLQCAHNDEVQVLHLDVNPSNFLIRRNIENPACPNLLLADFGITKFLNKTGGASKTVRGTSTYMAPEQIRGNPVPATDQYALAIMTYRLLTGHLPFQGSFETVMYQHLNVQPQDPSTRNPAISTAIDKVILRALNKKPEERYPSITEFAQAFQNALQPGQDIRVTMAISEKEALNGTNCALTLSGGRQVTMSVPAGASNSQEIRYEGKGSPSPYGGPAGALIITLSILKMNGHAPLPGIQSLTQPLHLSNDIAVLIGNAHSNQAIANHLNDLSQSVTALQTNLSSSDQMMAQRLQNLSNTLTNLQANPKADPAIIKWLDDIIKSIGTLQSGFKSDPVVIKRLDDLAQAISNLQSNPKSDSVFIKELTKLSSTITALHSDNGKDNQAIVDKLKDLSVQVDGIVKSNPGGAPKTSTRRISGNLVVLLVGVILLILVNSIGLFNVYQANRALSMIQATSHTFTASTTVADSFDPYPPYNGKLTLFDPLNQSEKFWSSNSNCHFSNGAYHISQSVQYGYFVCEENADGWSNFAFEVQMEVVKGDCGGIVFRDDGSGQNDYFFDVCQNGTYHLARQTTKNKAFSSDPLASGSSQAIHTGLNQFNLIAVVANASDIYIYVNYQEIGSAIDSTYSHGTIALISLDLSKPTEVIYSYAKVWALAGGQPVLSSPTPTTNLGGS